ncbi:hypothetical protein DLE01_16560 [Streptomyces sp. FT05W]|nr:hypothetical protein [Streptomyces sp. FT05W]PWS50728.1 hypothetical protein DLE01_16560 [Streptomyces sp. FT05W]
MDIHASPTEVAGDTPRVGLDRITVGATAYVHVTPEPVREDGLLDGGSAGTAVAGGCPVAGDVR